MFSLHYSNPISLRVSAFVWSEWLPLYSRSFYYLSTHARPICRIVARTVEDRSSLIPPRNTGDRILYCWHRIFSDNARASLLPFCYYYWRTLKRETGGVPASIDGWMDRSSSSWSFRRCGEHAWTRTNYPLTYLPARHRLDPDRSDSRSVIIILQASPYLVPFKILKLYKISYHIESLNASMKY